ncbi:MAG: ABC transporter ATP-binding protein [Armatimonadetes bacterium]|nr:ABC transporter ATP-binding protein [Armatimonadota bacterium]
MADPEQTSPGFLPTARRLWTYARRYRTQFIIAIIATIILNFASLIRPWLLKILTDQVLTGSTLEGKIPLLLWVLAGLFGATVVKGVFTYVQGLSLNLASHGTVRDLREDVYAHLLRLPLPWFEGRRVADILVRFTDDLRVTIEFMTSGLTNLTNDVVIFITAMSWMLFRDWKMTLVGMVVTPLAGVVVRRFSRKVSAATSQAQERLDDLSSIVHETVKGQKVVKSFNRESHEGDRFRQRNEETFRWAMRIVQYTATQSPIVEVLATAGIAVVLWYCATEIILGRMTFGDLLAFWAYMLMATTPINRMPATVTTVQRGCTALARILEIRDTPTEDLAPRPDLPPVKGEIEFRDVRFRYQEGREEALQGINLRVAPGEHVAIVGRNGAGKSTLVNLLPRFYDLQEGDILIDGVSIRDVSLGSLRSQIGIVPQETFLFSGTIRKNLRYGRLEASDDEIVEVAKQSNSHNFILNFTNTYDAALSQGGGGLSGGQKQRIAATRMMLKNPPIVILDEATSAMDPEAEKAFQDTLESLTHGRTVLSIAHRMVACRIADRIVVLDRGKVVEEGSHDELLARQGTYHQLYMSMLRDEEGS